MSKKEMTIMALVCPLADLDPGLVAVIIVVVLFALAAAVFTLLER